jgi:PTH1 family peptidyl-tRNA hydrolase
MVLIVGLGNPGEKYKNTRHNIGFQTLDNLAKKLNLKFKEKQDYFLAVSEKVVLVKPTTYMNLSGIALVGVIKKYPIDDIMVVFDDINLEIGQIRIREKGGDGGHNGIKSIISELGHDQFVRLRIGIGNDSDKKLSDFVLSNFSEDEKKILTETTDFCTYLIQRFLSSGYQELLNNFSKMKNSYSKKITEILESLDQRRIINE